MREPFGRARVYLTALLLVEVFLGLIIILVTYLYQRALSLYMADMERRMLGGQFFNTYILGFQLVVVYLSSIAMWANLWSRRCTPNVHLLLSLWMFFCFVIVFCGFGTIWSLFACADSLENTAEMSLLKGIDLYYTCPEWKLLWDGLQYHKECCGVHGYKDWMNASWMPSPATQQDKCAATAGSTETTMAPYACCKHTCATCYENYIPRADNTNIPSLTLGQINTEGCLPLFTSKMWEIMYVLLALELIAFKLDLVICFLAKYIIRNQSKEDCCSCNNPSFDDDDDGRPMVVVKCPPNVRCVTFDEDEDVSTNQLEQNDAKKAARMANPCNCCNDTLVQGYTVRQEVTHMNTPTPTPSQNTINCECGSRQEGGGVGIGAGRRGGNRGGATPRIIH